MDIGKFFDRIANDVSVFQEYVLDVIGAIDTDEGLNDLTVERYEKKKAYIRSVLMELILLHISLAVDFYDLQSYFREVGLPTMEVYASMDLVVNNVADFQEVVDELVAEIYQDENFDEMNAESYGKKKVHIKSVMVELSQLHNMLAEQVKAEGSKAKASEAKAAEGKASDSVSSVETPEVLTEMGMKMKKVLVEYKRALKNKEKTPEDYVALEKFKVATLQLKLSNAKNEIKQLQNGQVFKEKQSLNREFIAFKKDVKKNQDVWKEDQKCKDEEKRIELKKLRAEVKRKDEAMEKLKRESQGKNELMEELRLKLNEAMTEVEKKTNEVEKLKRESEGKSELMEELTLKLRLMEDQDKDQEEDVRACIIL